jgi:hypothetical protein
MSNSGAFSRCIRIRVVLQAAQNPSLSAPIFVRECQRWLPVASRSVLQTMKEEKESGTPKDADPYPPHLRAARPLQRALACRRSTTAPA